MKKIEKCRVCCTPSEYVFTMKYIEKYDVGFFECSACRYIQTETPYWLTEAYGRTISASDTGIMVRNLYNSRLVLATLYLLDALDGVVVDFAGGYGILVRLLRDLGIDTFWSDKYSENLVAFGFEYKGEAAHLVTAFEAFEHFVHPKEELAALFDVAPNVLISTEIAPSPTPLQKEWWYYGPEHGQHIGFFRVETLRQMAASHGKRLVTDGRYYHLFTDQPLSLWKWRLTRKIISKLPSLLAGRLKSKVWSDHQYISDRSTAA